MKTIKLFVEKADYGTRSIIFSICHNKKERNIIIIHVDDHSIYFAFPLQDKTCYEVPVGISMYRTKDCFVIM